MSQKSVPRLSRRTLLLRGLATMVTFAVPLILSRTARAYSATQIWRCTYGDCEPYLYDPAEGAPNPMHPDHRIPPGVAFEDLPDDWICPVCGSKKALFKKVAKTA